jgi:Mn2+/Fe2+ NRAMP family transporter
MTLLGLFVTCVLAATATELAEFQAVGRGLLILGRHVIPALAILTLKHNIIAWHGKPL